MTPDKILGWSLDVSGKHSHLVCESAVVVGTRSAVDGLVKFLLCGHTSETIIGVADEANQPMCSKCLSCAFKLAKRDALPDMETRALAADKLHHFHSDKCYGVGPGDTEVLICGYEGSRIRPSIIVAHVCGGRQARICPVTKTEHDMSVVVRFKDGGSVACKDCGATAMEIDMMEMP